MRKHYYQDKTQSKKNIFDQILNLIKSRNGNINFNLTGVNKCDGNRMSLEMKNNRVRYFKINLKSVRK